MTYPTPGKWDWNWLIDRMTDLKVVSRIIDAAPFICEFGIWNDTGNAFRADMAQRDLYIENLLSRCEQ